MAKFITAELLGEREKRILGGHVDLVDPINPFQSVKKGQIVLKNNRYYVVKKDGVVDLMFKGVPNAEYLKPLNLSSGGGGLEIEELKKKLFSM